MSEHVRVPGVGTLELTFRSPELRTEGKPQISNDLLRFEGHCHLVLDPENRPATLYAALARVQIEQQCVEVGKVQKYGLREWGTLLLERRRFDIAYGRDGRLSVLPEHLALPTLVDGKPLIPLVSRNNAPVGSQAMVFDFRQLVRGKRAAVDRLFGRPTSVDKKPDHTIVRYEDSVVRGARLSSIVASFTPDGRVISLKLDMPASESRNWRAVLQAFGLSLRPGEGVDPNHQYSPDQTRLVRLRELPKGEVRINWPSSANIGRSASILLGSGI